MIIHDHADTVFATIVSGFHPLGTAHAEACGFADGGQLIVFRLLRLPSLITYMLVSPLAVVNSIDMRTR